MAKNPITIEALEVIDAIERRGSFASAAEELGKATSALSYIVQRLEEQLAVSLFTRQGRRSVLTAAGRTVLEDGRMILTATYRLKDKTQEVATGWEPRLNISVGAPSNYSFFFDIIKVFLDTHPAIELDITEHILNGGWELLEQGKVDLIVNTSGPVPKNKGYRSVKLGTNELALVVSKQHPLAKWKDGREKLAALIPKARRVVAHDTTSVNVAISAGLTNNSDVFYVQNMDQKVIAQLAGIGIGHLPRSRIQHLLKRGDLVELDFEDTQKSETAYMAWRFTGAGRGLKALTNLIADSYAKSNS